MAKPTGAVHVREQKERERGPEDLLSDGPPEKLETEAAVAELKASRFGLDMRPIDGLPGVSNHRMPPGHGPDKCGSPVRGRGFCGGPILGGKCSACGQDYSSQPPQGGVNMPVLGAKPLG